MPIIDAAIIADVRAKIDSEFGPVDPALQPGEITLMEGYRDKLAACIAEAGIYVRDNATPIIVGVTAGGDTATGTLT